MNCTMALKPVICYIRTHIFARTVTSLESEAPIVHLHSAKTLGAYLHSVTKLFHLTGISIPPCILAKKNRHMQSGITVTVVLPSSLGGTWPEENLRTEENFIINGLTTTCRVSLLKEKLERTSGFLVADQILTCGGVLICTLWRAGYEGLP